jgi:hypothetical protein
MTGIAMTSATMPAVLDHSASTRLKPANFWVKVGMKLSKGSHRPQDGEAKRAGGEQ